MKKEKVIAQDKDNLKYLIENCIDKEGFQCDLNHIDTSLVTDMSELFSYSQFNGNISNWNVANVEDMSGMFCNSKFNGDISEWNVSRVKYMGYMFSKTQFSGDISQWNVSNVVNMRRMFAHSNFIGDLSQWDVSHVEIMTDMFHNASCPLPYWAHYESQATRNGAIESYLSKQYLEKEISSHESLEKTFKV